MVENPEPSAIINYRRLFDTTDEAGGSLVVLGDGIEQDDKTEK